MHGSPPQTVQYAGSNASGFALNENLPVPSLAERFAVAGRVQIGDFLTSASAARLRAHLEQSDRWRHIFNMDEQTIELPSADWDSTPESNRAAVLKNIDRVAAHDFQFQYDNIRVPDGAEGRAQSGTLLDRFAEFLSSQRALEVLMQITGSRDLAFADCQATRYRAGDFLTPHNDEYEGMHRRFAYVLSLTDWLPRWGGLLHFVDPAGGVEETITPRFNALSLFAIGQSHYVSQVATYAPIPRISVTGWLRTKLPD
jgi:SM-20-related protein